MEFIKSWVIFSLFFLLVWISGNLMVLTIGWPVTDDWYWFSSEGESFSLVFFWLFQIIGFISAVQVYMENNGI